MGIYDGAIAELKIPALPREQNERQKKVDETKLVFAHLTKAADLAQEYTRLRTEEEALEEKAKELGLKIEALTQLMDKRFEAEGIRTLKLKSGQSVEIRPEPYAQVSDKVKFRAWIHEAGMDDQLTLAWQTTNAIAKERILAGKVEITADGDIVPIPGVSIFVRKTPHWRKK